MSQCPKLPVAFAFAFAATLLMGLSAGPLPAQTTTATILGTVTDSSGGAVPDAMLRVINTGTGAVQVATTDGQGRYRVTALPVGEYDVQSEKIGFQTAVHKGVTLTVGSEVVADFSMTVGQVNQTVTVEGEVAQVETTSAAISNLVEPTQMRELPLNGRDLDQLILLAPGVTIMQAIGYTAANGFGSSYTVSGSRGRGQWEILDDNDVSNWQSRGSGSGVLGTSLGVDAIAEFQVLTNTYSAQYGGNGSVVNEVTRSGTNGFHGSTYEFIRNSALDARNFFDAEKKPLFQKNQFGGTLGGPIKRDKIFFFANYEALRQNTGLTGIYFIPDAAAHNGYVPSASGNYVCVNRPSIPYDNSSANNAACAATVPAAIQQYLPYFPLPGQFPTTPNNASGIYNGLLNATETFKAPASENYMVGRYDWTMSTKDSMFARYVYDGAKLFEANNTGTLSPLAPTGWATQDYTKNQFLSIEEKRVWSNNLISSTRGGYSRTLLQSYPTEDYGSIWQFLGTDTFGFKVPLNGDINITPLLNSNYPHAILGGINPFEIIQNKFSGGEDIYWNKGGHSLRFGASIVRVQSYVFTVPSAGTWTFPNVSAFLQNAPGSFVGTCLASVYATCASAGFSSAPVAPHEFLQSNFGFYLQDDWKVTSTVTLNVGLRYSPQTNPRDAFGTLKIPVNLPFSASFNPALPMPGCVLPVANPMSPTTPNQNACPPFAPGVTGYTPVHNVFLQNPSFRNLDPRVGIAWDPFKDHKTSVRVGYGIFHDLIVPYDYSTGFTNAPAGTGVTQTCGACSAFPNPFQVAGGFSPSGGTIDVGNRKTGYMQQYNVTVQRQFGRNLLSIGYVGSRGVNLIGQTDLNPPLPTGVPGAIKLSPTQTVLPYPPIAANLTGGTTTFPASANGSAIVDPTTGHYAYSNVVFDSATSRYSVVQNQRVDPLLGFYSGRKTGFWSRYNALQTSLVRRLTNNFQAQISYTYASCIATSSGTTGLDNQNTGEDSWNTDFDRGNCAFLVRSQIYTNGMYVLPFRNNRLVSGWQLGGIFQYHTGVPMGVVTGWGSSIIAMSPGAQSTNRPSYVVGCKPLLGTIASWVNQACFTMPPIGEPGNVGSYTIPGPDSMTFDASLVKSTRVSERFTVQFRAEGFNVFNRPNFRNAAQPNGAIFAQASPLPPSCATTPSTCSNFNGTGFQTTLTNTPARQVQFGLKIIF